MCDRIALQCNANRHVYNFFSHRSLEDLLQQVKPDWIVMSAHMHQLNDSTHQALRTMEPPKSQHHQVTRLLAHAMSLVQRDQEGELILVRRASALAGHGASDEENSGRSIRGGLAPWQVERVKRHIEEAFTGRININDIAHMTRLSCGYFSAAFRVSFGTSPHDYICRRRADQSEYLIMTTDVSLCEVALDCGFADQSHLSRVFRRVTEPHPPRGAV